MLEGGRKKQSYPSEVSITSLNSFEVVQLKTEKFLCTGEFFHLPVVRAL